MHPPTRKQVQLHTAHDARSLVGIIERGPLDSLHRFTYQLEGSPIPLHIDIPKRILNPTIIPGVRTIITLVVTQVEMMEVDVPVDPVALPGLGGLNGHKL